jgi:hypothetical protein
MVRAAGTARRAALVERVPAAHGSSCPPETAMNTIRTFPAPASLHLAMLAVLGLSPVLACDDESAPLAQDEMPTDESTPAVDATRPEVGADAPRDGEIRVNGTVVADLELPRGPRLVFIDVAAPEAAPAIGVYEFVPTGHLGTNHFDELAAATPLELFRAASTADVAVPPRLLATEGAPEDRAVDADAPARGWLISAVAEGLAPRGICTNDEFTAVVESFGYNDLGTPVLRLDKEPGVSGYFETNIYNFFPQMAVREAYRYTVGGSAGSGWLNIDAYYTRVAVCALGSHPSACGSGGCVAHPGPTVNIAYRNDDDEPFGYQTVVNHDYASTGVSSWHWQSGSNWDWRTRIDIAAEGDNFDIGHAVHVD